MAVTVPSSHTAYDQSQVVANLKTKITANAAKNPSLALALKDQLDAEQQRLVNVLMSTHAVPASAILNTMAFGAADLNA